jgi:DNA-binding CsgD family transcriptional regulator
VRATRRGLPLVDREIQILGLIAQGGSYAEIAAQLHLAHASVKNYAASAIKKLGARSQAHAVYLACQQKILEPNRRHGDHAGYAAHLRRGETPCDDCAKGEIAYRAARRQIRRQQAA